MILINHKAKAVVDLELGFFTYIPLGKTQKSLSQTIRIGTKEVALLRLMTQRRNSLITREEMLTTIWNGRVVCENTVAVALSNLRKLFRRVDVECHCLVTITGGGYIFYPSRSGFVVVDGHAHYTK